MISEEQKRFFKDEGYLIVENLLTLEDISYYNSVYNSFLNNTINAAKYRSDLSGSNDLTNEKITQIMVPSRLMPELLEKPIHKRVSLIAKQLLGDDIALDFDMLINKAPNTNTITPWHQDAAYWIDLPDKRAVSCWMAIDSATLNNGCMWYEPKSHLKPTLRHIQTGDTGALQCEGSERDAIYIELEPGSCVFHHGNTLHYSRGNSTQYHRRAFITNFRPIKMIELERHQGYDHTGERKV